VYAAAASENPRRRVVLPFHADKTLHPKILEAIIQDAALPREAFEE
jgi:predicted RNA binding protein YcfA (HicA-like mRNA interferase family)